MKAAQGPGKFSAIAVAAAAALIAGTMSAKAATYYVSQSTGNKSWTGQAASPEGATGPWKTLAQASTNNYVAGDRILLPVIDRQDFRKDSSGIRLSDQEGFKIKEDPSSKINRYVIECWDAKQSSRWFRCRRDAR